MASSTLPLAPPPATILALPDDVIYLVLAHLETARDILALLLTNTHLKTAIQASNNQGWRHFVRARFPALPPLPTSSSSSSYTWPQLADSLTWQARAWDRRAVAFQAMLPTPPPPPQGQPQQRRGGRQQQQQHRAHRQQTPFRPVVAAHCDLEAATRHELVVWGAGENIVARRQLGRRTNRTPKETKWHSVLGSNKDYRAGYDDITALTLVDHVGGKAGHLGMLVGRDNGHLALLSAHERTFGQDLADLSPKHAEDAAPGWTPENINAIDVLASQGRVAVAARSSLYLYTLPQDAEPTHTIAPSARLSFGTPRLDEPCPAVGGAKWLNPTTLALGLTSTTTPLRYTTLTPTGFSPPAAVTSTNLDTRFNLDPSTARINPSTLTPLPTPSIAGGHGSTLLLAAYKDGTVRLQDLRSPAHSLATVYADNIDPYSELTALLAIGTSHFLGGGPHGAAVKVFDLRWPRKYYHTAGLPCGGDAPLPRPHQPFLAAPTVDPTCSRCEPVSGRRCRWHALSRSLYYRPNGTFFFSKSLPRADAYASVWSFAQSHALSPTFYIGISNGVVEASLSTALDVDPLFGYAPAIPRRDMMADSPGYHLYDLDASLIETGDGLLDVRNERNVRMPPMRGKTWRGRGTGTEGGVVKEEVVRRHRLDARYHAAADFEGAISWLGEWDKASWFKEDAAGRVA